MNEDNRALGKRWKNLPWWKRFLESPMTYWTLLKIDISSRL